MERVKIKFKVASGSVVIDYKNDYGTVEEAKKLLESDDVISISVVKQTPAQYFRSLTKKK